MTSIPIVRISMDKKKKMNLESKGWVVGNTGDFLELTPEETRLIEAYGNYIKLFPKGALSANFLAAAGGIYYNHKKSKIRTNGT